MDNNVVFQKLFSEAEIAQYSDEEYADYEVSLKHYRDLKNSLDTAFGDGRAEGFQEGMERGIERGGQEKEQKIIIKAYHQGANIELIAAMTGLEKTQIVAILQQANILV